MSRIQAGIHDPSALASGRGASWKKILAGVVAATWAIVAVAFHNWLYDGVAVATSILLLTAAAAFFVWEAPPGRQPLRLLGFFVFGQAFISSGMGVVMGEDESVLHLAPTTEAFSFAVESAGLFAFAFMVGAALTVPRKAPPSADEETTHAGPTTGTAVVLASLAALYSMALATMVGSSTLERLGMLPLLLVNPELLLPFFVASRLLTRRRMTLPIIILVGSQVFVTFFTSMLGATILVIRDGLLANVLLGRKLPLRWIAPVVVAVILLNPVKHIFREQAFDVDEDMTTSAAFEFWNEAITTTWEDRPRSEKQPGLDSTLTRLNYNSMSAHVYTMLQGRLPFEGGDTYEDIPTLLIPRAIYPDKPTTTYMRGRWLIKLGLQDRESVERTSFAVPASAEAYWNFGWLGVPGIAFALGLIVGAIFRLAPRDAVARVAFLVLAVVVLGQFVDMLIWVIPKLFVIAVTGAVLRVYVQLGKRRRSPAHARAPRLEQA